MDLRLFDDRQDGFHGWMADDSFEGCRDNHGSTSKLQVYGREGPIRAFGMDLSLFDGNRDGCCGGKMVGDGFESLKDFGKRRWQEL